MPQATDIRDACETDRSLLIGFHKRLYETHRDRVVAPRDVPLIAYRDYERILADDVRALLQDRTAHILIAERENEPVGYITGRVNVESRRVLPRRGVIEDWYVEEAIRGRGVGRRLFEALEARFRDAGCQVVESATWSGNEGARRTHDALGFREIRVLYRKLL